MNLSENRLLIYCLLVSLLKPCLLQKFLDLLMKCGTHDFYNYFYILAKGIIEPLQIN